MKKLNPLDQIVLELAIEDFKDNKLELHEVTKALSNYESNEYDTSQYRFLLEQELAHRYHDLRDKH